MPIAVGWPDDLSGLSIAFKSVTLGEHFLCMRFCGDCFSDHDEGRLGLISCEDNWYFAMEVVFSWNNNVFQSEKVIEPMLC